MDRRVELPSGGWAVLRDPATVTNKERRPILAEMARQEDRKDVPVGEQTLERLTVAQKYVELLVKSWSLDIPVPREAPDWLDDIPALDLDFLCLRVQDPESAIFLPAEAPDPKDQKDGLPNSGNFGTDSSTTTSASESISLPSSVSTA